MAIMTLAEVKTYPGYTTDMSDAHISLLLLDMPNRLRNATGNKFIKDAVQIISTGISFDEEDNEITVDVSPVTTGFVEDDNLLVEGSVKNDGYFTADDVAATTIEVDEDLVDEDLDEEVTISYVFWPRDVKQIVVNMMRYDIIEREKKKGLASESIGDYSVSWGETGNVFQDYPKDIVGGLLGYMKPIRSY